MARRHTHRHDCRRTETEGQAVYGRRSSVARTLCAGESDRRQDLRCHRSRPARQASAGDHRRRRDLHHRPSTREGARAIKPSRQGKIMLARRASSRSPANGSSTTLRPGACVQSESFAALSTSTFCPHGEVATSPRSAVATLPSFSTASWTQAGPLPPTTRCRSYEGFAIGTLRGTRTTSHQS